MKKRIAIAALMAACFGTAHAAVSPEEAKALGTTLTKFGAEVKASADGLVPAYSDAPVTPPASYKEGSGVYTDPYAGEKPSFSVTSKNMAQYADKLTEGQQALLKRYPDFRIDVYPTHRSVRYPEYVLDATVKNATKSTLSATGYAVKDSWGGLPFPIPKSGNEALWNHLLVYTWPFREDFFMGFLVDASGNATDIGDNKEYRNMAYYDPNAKEGDWMYKFVASYSGPPSQVGEKILVWQPTSYDKNDQTLWIYQPGLRRVRLAPDFSYDTPESNYGGSMFYDETNMFSGKMDRFNWKLLGKKEMIVPYNDYQMAYETDPKVLLGKQFMNPDKVRWEVHRVWVLEADLKPNARHAYSKRIFYLDEDSWGIIASDSYDHAGNLYRIGFSFQSPHYGEYPDPGYFTWGFYDLSKNNYVVAGLLKYMKLFPNPRSDAQWLTPDSMSGSGVR